MPTETTTPDWAPGLEQAFSLPTEEGSYVIEGIEGTIPPYVRGIHYLNGPGRFAVGHVHYRHWLDGDGMITSVRFTDSEVRFTNRFVQSTKVGDEAEAGRALYRTFGTTFESDRLFKGVGLASPVNVSAYLVGENLLAFGEQGLPWELDAYSLETMGSFDFDRQINFASPFSAHPKFDLATGEMFNFGIAYSATRPRLNLYRFDRRGELVYRRWIPIDHPRSMHDFALGTNHVVFFLNPHLLDMGVLLQNGGSFMDGLEWTPEIGTYLLIAARENGEPLAKVKIDTGYCLHTINVFDEGSHVIVDVVELERPVYDQYEVLPDILGDVPYGSPVRYVIDLESQQVVKRTEIDYRLASEFPHVDPAERARPYDEFWMVGISAAGKPGRKCFDQLVHASWKQEQLDLFALPAGSILGGEPTFVGDPSGETGGAVICHVFDGVAMKSEFAIFDARAVADGPIARLPLRAPVRIGFHSSFAPESALPPR